MRLFSPLGGSLALAAMLASAATPALADHGRWRGGWGGPRYPYHHHRGGDGFGVFLGLAALVGAAAVVASSAANDRRAEDRSAPPPPPPPPSGGHYDDGYAAPPEGAYEDDRSYDQDSPSAEAESQDETESTAVEDCTQAAEAEGAQEEGGPVQVRDITGTRPWDGGWAVEGTLDMSSGEGIARRFSCTWRDGQVADLMLSRDSIAMR